MPDIASLLGRLPGGMPGGAPGGAPAGPPGAPGAPPPPPGMAPARPNAGPATSPQPNAGNEAAAMNDLQNALKMIEKALPALPMGSPMHGEVLKIASQLSKHLQAGEGSHGLQMQSLLQMARQQAQSAPMQALARMQQPAGAPPAMPGGGGGEGGGQPMPMAA